ncbi:MAG: SagB/ThcOx family dehydrogenase [Candidatus Heimdallarchaeota archaeon]
MEKYQEIRKFLKNPILAEESDQQKGLPVPPMEKPVPEGAKLIDLISSADFSIPDVSLQHAINNRSSRRKFTDGSLSLEELSFLLWSTQGVKELARGGLITKRTVPSGGAMHPFETYLLINRVDGLETGLYRYIATQHKLLPVITEDVEDFPDKINEICHSQTFIGKSAVVFIWTARPYRTEWRYREDSLKDILMSVGHICQNLYLAVEAIDAGTVAIVAYKQDELDKFLQIDGWDEISLYVAPVGKI